MHRSMTLKQRITLGLAAFLLALAAQIFLSFYQSGTVLRELDDQMGRFNAISRFQDGVERSLTALSDYRWEYGDADELLTELDAAFSTTNAWLWRIDGDLSTVSEVSLIQCGMYHLQELHGAGKAAGRSRPGRGRCRGSTALL